MTRLRKSTLRTVRAAPSSRATRAGSGRQTAWSLLTGLAIGLTLLSLVPAFGGTPFVMTVGCAASDHCSLEELFEGGQITVLDKIFDRWELIKVGFDPGPYDFGNFSDVDVFGIFDDPLRPGIRFVSQGNTNSTRFFASQFYAVDFGFHVSTVSGDPRILSVEMDLIETSFGGPGGRVKVDETLFTTNSTYLADIWVEDDNQFDGGLQSDSAEFEPQSDVFVEKNVLIEPAYIRGNVTMMGGPRFDAGTAELVIFEQRFGQVPPTSTPTPTATATATATSTPTITATPTVTNTPAPQGADCVESGDCETGLFCSDTVCCDTACDGLLEVCNIPGQVGSCIQVAAPAPAASRGALVVALVLLLAIAALGLTRRGAFERALGRLRR